MLNLKLLLAQGRTRLVYQHPEKEQFLIKVSRPYSFREADKTRLYLRTMARVIAPRRLSENRRELENYLSIGDSLSDYLPEFYPRLVPTDKGAGIVVGKIRDENTSLSISLDSYIKGGNAINPFLQSIIKEFFNNLVFKKIYFFDFNPHNFLLQHKSGTVKLFFIDLKGYKKDRSILPLTHLHPRFSEAKMIRRIERFYRKYMPIDCPPFDAYWG